MSDFASAGAGDFELKPKQNADGSMVRDCWTTTDGYTVALCRLPENRWTVTRPGGRAPFLYTGHKPDVRKTIIADRQASRSKVASDGR